MNVRPGTMADLKALTALGVAFYEESPLVSGPANPDRIAVAVQAVLAHGNMHVLEQEHIPTGLLAVLIGPHPHHGLLTAFEVAWFVDPSVRGIRGGVRLVREAERTAQIQGAQRIQIGAPNPRVGALLEHLGYRAVETQYVKELAA